MNEGLSRSTDIVPSQGMDLRVPEKVLKSEIGVIPVWLGQRMLDNSDLETFNHILFMHRQFGLYPSFEIPDAGELGDSEPYPALADVDLDMRKVLCRIKGPVAVFIVAPSHFGEYPWVINMNSGIQQVRKEAGLADTFVYKVFMGGFGFKDPGSKDSKGLHSRKSTRAHELGGVYLPYSGDYPTPCTERLVEFMNRVMGADLPGDDFPNYSDEDIWKIAKHIWKENFNAWEPREGSIDKYPIVDGKPQFPW